MIIYPSISRMSFKTPFFFLLLSLFTVSCSEDGRLKMNPAKYFKSVEYLEGKEVLSFDDYGVYRPTSFVMHDDYIYVQNRDEDMLCAIDRSTGAMESLLKRGDGPGEVLNIAYITMSGDAVITAESNKRYLIEIPFHSKKPVFTSLPFDQGAPTSVVKGRDGYVMLGSFKDGRYMYCRPTTGKTGFFGDYRVHYLYNRLDNFTKSLIYISSKLAIKPDMTRFVAINFNSGVIDINRISQDTIINLKQLDFHYQEIHVTGSRDNPRVATKRSNRNGFFDVTASDEHIYAIYSGKSFEEAGLMLDKCEHLMIFDWDGSPVGCYKLNVPIYSICYNQQERALYGIHIGDEAKLLKFDFF